MAKKQTNALDLDAVLAELDLFKDLSKADRRHIRKLFTTLQLPAGKVFIKEGTLGREAFIIAEGTAAVKRGGKLLATLGPGDIVGEMALLTGDPRMASVEATSDIVVEVMSRAEFDSLLDDQPKLARKLMTTAFKRIHEISPPVVG